MWCCGWAAWSYPAGHQDTSQPTPAQPSPAQPRHPSVHLQTAAGEAAVSLFMETRVDGSRYYQHQIRAAPVQCAGHILPVTTLSLVTTHHIHTEILLMTITYLQSAESAYLLRTPLIKTIDKAHDRHTSNIASSPNNWSYRNIFLASHGCCGSHCSCRSPSALFPFTTSDRALKLYCHQPPCCCCHRNTRTFQTFTFSLCLVSSWSLS